MDTLTEIFNLINQIEDCIETDKVTNDLHNEISRRLDHYQENELTRCDKADIG